jgi:ribosomal protein S27AE
VGELANVHPPARQVFFIKLCVEPFLVGHSRKAANNTEVAKAMKICSRCYFAVSSKRRSCGTCGNNNFIFPPIVVIEGPTDLDFKHRVRWAWRDLRGELINTWCRLRRAIRRFVTLIERHEVRGGSADQHISQSGR